ncbi:type II toxin-antitoxin system VapC family toxin [Armatimonas sp.]|uniref:type II toxin-antitoxin system VapC family toxin n=1 Tax=Armatimonas sp. TaxID=1872638 RepID=UPI00374D8777
MTRFLLDTDTLSLFRRGDPEIIQRLRITRPEEIAITVISVEEQLAGWYDQIRRLTVPFLASFRILPFTELAMTRYDDLRGQRLNVGANDLKIAAIALECGAIIITRNTRDYGRVPNLITEDWSRKSEV